jgi:hypothetical protein
MSVFRNELRREHSRMRAADDVAAMAEAQATQPMPDKWADAAAQERARRTAVPEAEVEDAVVVTPEHDDKHPPPAATDNAPPRPALISGDAARDLRTRWDATQIGFVDDPRQAVQQADELVAAVIEKLERTLTDERKQLEAEMTDTASTENLRMALQHYRSFFRRLLSL